MKNVSDRDLTESERSLLEKGLNFAVTLKHIHVTEIITATETAIKNSKLEVECKKRNIII